MANRKLLPGSSHRSVRNAQPNTTLAPDIARATAARVRVRKEKAPRREVLGPRVRYLFWGKGGKRATILVRPARQFWVVSQWLEDLKQLLRPARLKAIVIEAVDLFYGLARLAHKSTLHRDQHRRVATVAPRIARSRKANEIPPVTNVSHRMDR
jgi:hypothetical protein